MSASKTPASKAPRTTTAGATSSSDASAAAPGEEPAATRGYTPEKDALLKRLRRIEGQVRGVARMVDEDTYCIDVLTQMAAINKALHAVSLELLDDHIGHCVVGAAQESDEAAAEKVTEATAAIGRLLRS